MTRRLGYRPSLDGVRAIAILAVMGYHSAPHQLKGGFVGVDIFFVLSGFLITTLLLQEWSAAGHVALRDFYGRRARRLLPALFVTLGLVGVVYAVDPKLNNGIAFWKAVPAVVFYSGNWVAAFARNPVQILALLDHTWSLAIEEQFYIAWPLLLLVALRRRWSASLMLVLTASLALASALVRISLWHAHAGGHLYFRTDCHADGLLIGCTVAIAWSSEQGRGAIERRLGGLAATALAVLFLLAFVLTVGPNDAFVFDGGLLLVALAAAAVIAHAVADKASPLTRLLSQRPLVWIGARSYGMYLYHIPVFGVIAATSLHSSSARIVVPLQVAVTMLAAAASYRWVETPFLRRRRLGGAPPHVQRAPTEGELGVEAIAVPARSV